MKPQGNRRWPGRLVLTAFLAGAAGLAIWAATWPRRNVEAIRASEAAIEERAAAATDASSR